MALFKMYRGNSTNFNFTHVPFHDGYVYFLQDTQQLFVDVVINGVNCRKEIAPKSAFKGATAGQAGDIGDVPAPAAGKNTAFLRGDGQWTEISPAQFIEIGTTNQTTPSSTLLAGGLFFKKL